MILGGDTPIGVGDVPTIGGGIVPTMLGTTASARWGGTEEAAISTALVHPIRVEDVSRAVAQEASWLAAGSNAQPPVRAQAVTDCRKASA